MARLTFAGIFPYTYTPWIQARTCDSSQVGHGVPTTFLPKVIGFSLASWWHSNSIGRFASRRVRRRASCHSKKSALEGLYEAVLGGGLWHGTYPYTLSSLCSHGIPASKICKETPLNISVRSWTCGWQGGNARRFWKRIKTLWRRSRCNSSTNSGILMFKKP